MACAIRRRWVEVPCASRVRMRRARRRGGVKRVGDMERHDEGDKKRFKKRSSSHVKTLIHVASDGARRAMVREDDERVLTQRESSSHAYTKGIFVARLHKGIFVTRLHKGIFVTRLHKGDLRHTLTQRGSSSHAYTKGSSSHALERASMRSRTTRAVE